MKKNILVLLSIITLLAFTSNVCAHPDYGCKSCHVPHNAAGDNSEVPLWNPEHTTTTLTDNYQTTDTTNADVGAPDGASKLCLSCHDGTYSHVSSEHSFGEGVRVIGTDPTTGEDITESRGMGSLRNSHPISFVYDNSLATADGELVDPSTLATDVLDSNSKMQCTSCHDVHATAADYGTENFMNLRWNYLGYKESASFCRNCHIK